MNRMHFTTQITVPNLSYIIIQLFSLLVCLNCNSTSIRLPRHSSLPCWHSKTYFPVTFFSWVGAKSKYKMRNVISQPFYDIQCIIWLSLCCQQSKMEIHARITMFISLFSVLKLLAFLLLTFLLWSLLSSKTKQIITYPLKTPLIRPSFIEKTQFQSIPKVYLNHCSPVHSHRAPKWRSWCQPALTRSGRERKRKNSCSRDTDSHSRVQPRPYRLNHETWWSWIQGTA